MTAFLNSTPPILSPPPPRHWLTQNLTLAWLRLGKAAVFSVLAGLAVAAGLAFSGADAAAQGAQGGYTYTARVCQEYGQQPRWYNVRDGQAAYNGGNSDSGWLIVLERGANIAPAQYEFTSPIRGGGTNSISDALAFTRISITPPHIGVEDPDNPVGSRITASDGTIGFVTSNGRRVVIDRNNNGEFDAGDLFPGGGPLGGSSLLHYHEERGYQQTRAPASYGAQIHPLGVYDVVPVIRRPNRAELRGLGITVNAGVGRGRPGVKRPVPAVPRARRRPGCRPPARPA